MCREVEAIVRAVTVPVNADIEAGYGDAPVDVARTVTAFLAAGAVGLNLEDATGDGAQPLYTLDDQQRRLDAARTAADAADVPAYLNARTDTYLTGFGATEAERLAIEVDDREGFRKDPEGPDGIRVNLHLPAEPRAEGDGAGCEEAGQVEGTPLVGGEAHLAVGRGGALLFYRRGGRVLRSDQASQASRAVMTARPRPNSPVTYGVTGFGTVRGFRRV